MQAMEVRDREIEFRLDGYARARLSPDPQAIARSRARIMRDARLQFEAAQLAAQLAPVVVAAARRSMIRRVAMPLLAASVWAVIAVGSMSAAQPGGPLYTTRMWVENATLPATGAARAMTELARLETRLLEAGAAAARGDAAAVQAALDAYRQIADETIAAASGDDPLEALVAAALDKHLAVLTAVAASLSDKGNETAAAAVAASIQKAIVHNQAVIDRIDQTNSGGAGGGNGGTDGTGANPGGGNETGDATGTGSGTGTGTGAKPTPATGPGTGSGTGAGAGAGVGTGGPEKPPKSPKPTPPPKPTPEPAATPSAAGGRPDHSPRQLSTP